MNTKFIAAFAVFAMMFAGVGAIFVAEANDADATKGDIVVVVDGFIADEDVAALIGEFADKVEYRALLDEDLEDEITVINLKYYEALENADLIEGDYVIFSDADIANSDVKNGLKAFTSAEFSKTGKLIGGVDVVLTFVDVAGAVGDVAEFEIVDAEAAEAAIAIAVALATEDMYTEEEVAEAIAEALSDVSEYIYTQEQYDAALAQVPAGYISQADADKAVADAVEKAKADAPKADDMYMYMFIIALAIAIALAGLFVYFVLLKPKAKEEAKAPKMESL